MQPADGVVISGASTGIGKACALLLDRSGFRVFAGVRREEAANELRQAASSRLYPVILDVTQPEHIIRAVETVKENLGSASRLFGLVNNAGICAASPTEFVPIDLLRRHLEVNVIGHIAVTQAFMPLIRSGKGRIINIGSATGRFALPYLGAYSASKHAMAALTDALRIELRPWRISVSIIDAGTVETPMWEKAIAQSHDLLDTGLPAPARELYYDALSAMERVMLSGRRRAIFPEDVATVVLKVLNARRPKPRYEVGAGSRMAVVGKLLPKRFTDWVMAMVLAKKLPTKVIGW
jgi:NAD(P)-dependent dehydrogenase (short-subunit alcohol dehydrogenase family)